MGHAVGVIIVASNGPKVVYSVWESKGRPGRIHGHNLTVGTAQIAVEHIIPVNVDSRDRPPVVQPYRTIGKTARALAAASARPRRIEDRELPVGTPQEAVKHGVRVGVDPCDSPPLIEAFKTTGTPGAFACACARGFERGEGAVATAYQAVLNKVVVHVVSHTQANKVDVRNLAAVTALRPIGFALAWSKKRRKCAVRMANEGVEQVIRIRIIPYDRSFEIKRYWSSAIAARAGNVEGRKFPLRTAQEAVTQAVRVDVESRDNAQVVDGVGAGAPHDGVRTGNVKICEFPFGGTHEAVSPVAAIRDASCDCAKGIDTRRLSAIWARVGSVEADNAELLSVRRRA